MASGAAGGAAAVSLSSRGSSGAGRGREISLIQVGSNQQNSHRQEHREQQSLLQVHLVGIMAVSHGCRSAISATSPGQSRPGSKDDSAESS